jgi:hypothetical protein
MQQQKKKINLFSPCTLMRTKLNLKMLKHYCKIVKLTVSVIVFTTKFQFKKERRSNHKFETASKMKYRPKGSWNILMRLKRSQSASKKTPFLIRNVNMTLKLIDWRCWLKTKSKHRPPYVQLWQQTMLRLKESLGIQRLNWKKRS